MKWPTLIALAIVLVGLVMWDQILTDQQHQARQASARISPLLPDGIFEQGSVAAIRVDVGDDVHLYLSLGGIWLCETAFGAPAERGPVESIIPALQHARGVIRSTDAADAAEFGFDGPDAIRVAISGTEVATHPTGDVIYAVDLGRSIPATGGSYVRPVNTNEIWAVDIDLRGILGVDHDSRIAPMLDPHIVPQDWPGVRLGPTRITIERPDQPPVVINRRDRTGDGDPATHGLQWEWIVGDGESMFLGDLFQVTSYAVFLGRAPYAGILRPRPPQQVGLDAPRARITYQTAEGPQLQLIIGGTGPRGGIVVFNTFTQVMYEVEPDIVGLMLPSIDLLLDGSEGNPWERWMRR